MVSRCDMVVDVKERKFSRMTTKVFDEMEFPYSKLRKTVRSRSGILRNLVWDTQRCLFDI